ncbi:MAG: PAS domain-containing protein, partial [Gemmatimonadota bacterium]|nr:PAS domain-containing protein [Gemmatimonadota bacterium]
MTSPAIRSSHVGLVADVARLLAAAATPLAALGAVAELVREHYGARGCAIVRDAGERTVLASADRPDAGITGGIDAESALVAAGARVGVIELRSIRAGAKLDAVSVIADMLARVLVSAEQGDRLGAEVARRSRETEAQRRFIEKIIDSLPVGLYVIDRDFRIQAWNRKRETGMLGVSREEAIGRPIFEILHRQPESLLRGEFEDVFRTGAMRQFHMESATLGEPRTYRVSKIPMSLDDDRVSHVITIGEDMTAWTMAQERIGQAEKLAAVGQLAAGVMHEINNPLATIGACGESMALRLEAPDVGDDLRTEFAEYLAIIDHEVHRCTRIIDGLLHFSRPKHPARADCDINLVIGETLFLLKHHATFKRMQVETDLAPDLGAPVEGDAEQLLQVFMALLLNACDASGGAGSV